MGLRFWFLNKLPQDTQAGGLELTLSSKANP